MRILSYLLKQPLLASNRARAFAWGHEFSPRIFISLIASPSSSPPSSASSSFISNQLAIKSCPLTWPQQIRHRSLVIHSRYFVTDQSVGDKAEFEDQRQENHQDHYKMTQSVKAFERLPKSVVPLHYEITIKPDLVKLVFEGHENITLKVYYHVFISSKKAH